jgi:hypothetical protein
MRSYSGLLALGLFWLGALALPCDAADPRDIGKAVEIHNEVTAAQGSEEKRRLAKESPVREHELIEAAVDARGEFVLSDNTKLVVGPGASLLLDEFVYNPNQRAASKVVLDFAKGAFRFLTGSSSPEAYEIKTPVATIGIRGTIFDGFVADDGRMVLLLHPHRSTGSGGIEVCSNKLPGKCEPLRSGCYLMYVTASGRVSPQQPKWDNNLLPDVDFRTAFPFLERRPVVDPTIRCRYADLFTPEHVKKVLAPSMPQPALAQQPPPIPLIGLGIAVPLALRQFEERPASP